MSKQKKIESKAYIERLQRQISKDLEKKNFDSIEEANNYINSKYIGKEVSFDPKNLSDKEKAMELVFEAWECDSDREKIAYAERALILDKDCADAYNVLAGVKAETLQEMLEFYVKAIEAGKKSLGDDFEEFKGRFWGIQETRPFMRAMSGYSTALWYMGEKSKSVQVMKEMMELNPDDNQGVRYILITKLLILNRLLEAEKLYNDSKDDPTAHWHYSKAYLYFSKRSKQLYADKALTEAMESNPYVPFFLFGIYDMPEKQPDHFRIGDENEAVTYVNEAMELWATNDKAMNWIAAKFKKMQSELENLIAVREKERIERLKRFPGNE